MPPTYSIAEARKSLAELVYEVENGTPVEITRRGKPVAVVIAIDEYRKALAARPGFRATYEAWLATAGATDVKLSAKFFRGLRNRSEGRARPF